MRKLIILLCLVMVGCEQEYVSRPPKKDRFVVTSHGLIKTIQDTSTGKCWITVAWEGLVETEPKVCQ